MKDNVNRLGFEAWADNIIVNAIENMRSDSSPTFDMDEGDVTVVVRMSEGVVTATVRAYIKGEGWHYHDRTIKIK